MKREATISASGLYRFDLTRSVQVNCTCERCMAAALAQPFGELNPEPYILWVLSNPSTADAETDDPTERRCWGFTSSWGYSHMKIVNVNPYRDVNPKHVQIPEITALLLNEAKIKQHAHAASLIVCGWGNNANVALALRTQLALRLVAPREELHALGFTVSGVPKHPLYLASTTKPQLWKS